MCLVYLLTGVLHFLTNLSFADLGFVLPSIALLLKLAFSDSRNPEKSLIVDSIPSDMHSVIGSLQVEPETKSLICCSACFATYRSNNNDLASYPEFCTSKHNPSNRPCGNRLRSPGSTKRPSVPKREFVYQDIHHWIARMYCRNDIEEHLQRNPMPRRSNHMEDIWDGYILRELKGPDGLPFFDKPEGEGRLAFGLNMDGFNPRGNREAGKQTTICGVYLVCLNLPPEIRYKTENVFLLGVVPGPTEPSTHQVNHILRPLVDDLLLLWNSGIFLTRTPKCAHGYLVRAALIPIICDLPAARRVAGLGGHAAGYFCSECLQRLDEINDLNTEDWVPRTYDVHIEHANRWLHAGSDAERTKVFQEYGAKWSELLRLPYWDPTKFVVIDSMHGFYLRLFQRHIRDIWGMNVTFTDGDGFPDLTSDMSEETLQKGQESLRSGNVEDLQQFSREELQHLCRDLGLHYGGKKKMLIQTLTEYIRVHVSAPANTYRWTSNTSLENTGYAAGWEHAI